MLFISRTKFSFCILFIVRVVSLLQDRRGPFFMYEPPNHVEFSNTTGTVIPCSARATPTASIKWTMVDGSPVTDIPGLRHLRPDGSLVFPPFRAEDFRQDVHAAIYRCVATNPIGTIGSRDVKVRGVVNQQYMVEVYDEYAIAGTTAVLRCHIPGFVENYVTVTSWMEEPTSNVIQPSSALGGKYLTFPWGTLHIRNVEANYSYRNYKCQTRNRLTGEIVNSATTGRLIVTDTKSKSRPRITDYRPQITGKQEESVALPCAAQGFPIPSIRWYRLENGQLHVITLGRRFVQLDGTLILHQATIKDSGKYVCVANNSFGEEREHSQLLITNSLSATILPSLQLAHVGKSATINCSISGHPIHSVLWRKDLNPLSLSSRVILVSRDVLKLESVQREDKGMYQCFVYNDLESAQGTTELNLGDDTPEFQEVFPPQTIQPGPSLSLKCVATGNPLPQIIWKLDDSSIPENHRIRYGDYVTKDGAVVSYVNITSVQTEDGGEYQCNANNGVGEVSHKSRVNVLGPPVVRRMRNLTVVAGESLNVRCPVGGYPLETIHWERAGVRLPYNHRQKVHDNGTLEVHHVERATDEGPYTCVARNREGQSAQSTVLVRVQVKPVIEQFSFPKSLREGQRSSVSCTVGSGDLPIKIRWFKDGQPIPDHKGIRVNEVADYSSTLLFESLGLDHRGNYTCIASNEAGTVSHTASMVIHVPPRWVIEPSDASVVKGKSVVIDCQAEGFPQPRVRWTKADGDSPRDFKSIVSSPHLQVFENGSLAIHDVKEIDSGYYLCQASNGIGHGLSKVLKLKVHIAAHFKSKFTAEMVMKGHNTRLKCESYGDKPITVTWMKDKLPINPQADTRYELLETIVATGVTSEVLIRQADRRDSALFTCIATNSFGRDDTNIQLIIQESPDSPQDFKVLETSSRSVKLTWTAPFSGNSPITHYIIQYKDDTGKWHGKMPNVTVSGTESTATVQGLKPAKIYYFRMFAENRLGKSDTSRIIETRTQEETPGGPPVKVKAIPTSSQSIKVTWKPPSQELQYGTIKGYYVGYKIRGSPEPFVYKTMDVVEGFKEESHLTGLRRFTKYSIIVQAYNNKGTGPPSDEEYVQTLENDPPTTPSLKETDASYSSIQLSWDKNIDGNPVTGYYLRQRQENKNWEELHVSGEHNSYTALNLECGSRYQFSLIAYNSAGKGESSDILTAKTEGTVPVSPDMATALTYNSTSATVHMNSWHDGGCPLTGFLIRYRQKHETMWRVIAENVPAEQNHVDITGLTPNTWYDVLIIAENTAGSTETEYSFLTSPIFESITPKTVINKDTIPFYFDMTIILPVSVSLIVIIIVLIVVCLVVRKKNSSESSHCGSMTYGTRKSGQEMMPLSDLEKRKKHSSGSSYYPTPYATTQVSGRTTDDGTDSGYHQLQEEPLYATVKRTPRPPRSDAHIYQCPGFSMDTESSYRSQSSITRKEPGMIVQLDSDRRSSDQWWPTFISGVPQCEMKPYQSAKIALSPLPEYRCGFSKKSRESKPTRNS
ncbi:cell adhesion molecule Dscam1-like isoform X2 [Centruroides vittatus]|uniref:cell adhesion molecule Dscam1-like isoform X2 n=1 Tax=Centruroides vittatus TaxID=120091 RepID=UPI00350FE830